MVMDPPFLLKTVPFRIQAVSPGLTSARISLTEKFHFSQALRMRQNPSDRQLKILMLEDSPFDAELVQYFLRTELPGTTIHVAANRQQFVEELHTFSPDVLLSDNSLPDINATEALKISRAIIEHIPFIMVSGTVSEEFATELIRSGGDDYILKDRLTRLPVAIDAAIKNRKAEKDKRAAIDQLRTNEEKYRTLVERVTDAFISLDRNFCYTYLNRQAGELIHRDPMLLIGRNVWEEFPDAVGSPTYHAFLQAMQTQQYACNTDYYQPLDLWQENHIYPSEDGLSVFIRNITAQKKAQQAVRALEQEAMNQQIQEQKRVTRAIIRAQEKERSHIGRELHDNVNQILVASVISLENQYKQSPDQVAYPLGLVKKAITEIRVLSSRYVTPLKNINLEELVKTMLQQYAADGGFTNDFIYNLADTEDDEIKLNIYRIIQEQLNNIVKYAAAANVLVVIESTGQGIHIEVTDDGKGFDPAEKRNGIGISNMIHRVKTFNGEIAIRSGPGQGCSVKIDIPQ